MVFEDKFEYVHSNEKNMLEKFVASSSKHRDRGNGGAGGGRLNPFPPPPARFEMVEETSKEAKLADQVGSLFITMDMVYSFPAKYLSLEQLCLFTLSIPLRHLSRSPYSMLTLKASGYYPPPPPPVTTLNLASRSMKRPLWKVYLNQMCQQDFRWFTQLVGDKTRTQRVKISVER